MSELDHSEEQRAGSERAHRKHTDFGLPPIVDGRRLLPNHLVPGYKLTDDDINHLRELLNFHYRWLAFYEKLKEDTERELDDQFLYMHELQSTVRAPVTGYVLQDGRSKGVYADGWVAPILELHIRPLKPVDKFLIRGWRPPQTDAVRFDVFINSRQVLHASVGAGSFEIEVDCHEPLEERFSLRIECGQASLSVENGGSNDSRTLAFVLTEIRAEHRVLEEMAAETVADE
jgi:hypothetical protein